jgi:hypothetical protein
MFEMPKRPSKKFNFFMKRLFLQDERGVKKYHLVSWNKICQPKEQGGLR